MTSEQTTEKPTEDFQTRTTRVLYVDDDDPPPELSEAGNVALTRASTVSTARDRLAADGAVDCVVSEYDLPKTDGFELLECVRHDRPNLPFVVFTGSGSEAVASEAIRMGATDYLPKEAGGAQLRERIDCAVAAASVEADSDISGDRLREVTNAFPDVAFILDENGRYLEVLSGPNTRDLRTVDRDRLIGKRLHDAFEASKADRFLRHVRTTLESGSVETIEYWVENSAGERWFEGRTVPVGEPIDGHEAVVWVARDVTERRENERKLSRNREELTRLNRINGLINSIFQSLVGSVTREEIERTVCERLANSGFYRFAFVGGPWIKDQQRTPNVVAGADREKIERLVETTSVQSGESNTFVQVVRENEPVVVHDAANSERLTDEQKARMAELDVSSGAIVPLTYASTNYGVLAVSSTSPEAFNDYELAALETVGEIVAFAVNAVKNRNLILSDTAVELEFLVRDCETGFGRISSELDCRCELEGFVAASDERLVEYVTIEGVSTASVVERIDERDIADEWRVVNDDENCVVEVVRTSSGVYRLLKTGTVVTSGVAEDGDVRLVAEAPSDVKVREVVENFREARPNSELVCKQEVNRPVQTSQEFRQTLKADLTDKQRSALRAAYFGGYYEYPRESTGEDIADSLDISSPTLHQHLRAAQRKLVGAFLER